MFICPHDNPELQAPAVFTPVAGVCTVLLCGGLVCGRCGRCQRSKSHVFLPLGGHLIAAKGDAA